MSRLISGFVRMMALAFFFAVALQPAQGASSFPKEEIDQLVAPIALYPDTLLSQVLMASTYPADVADAATWSAAHANVKSDEAAKAVDGQQWDPSVKALIGFPQVLQMMGQKPDWVQKLGDAFLASSKDVLDSAQRLRARAQAAGTLKSSDQQKVIVDTSQPAQVIQIQPANPQVVYVPTYNPTVVYGAWPYPSYPPYYMPPPPAYNPGAALASGIAFGVGVGITASLWSDCDWHHGDVNINVNKYNNVNVHNQINANQTTFQHNGANRRGVPYRDPASQQKYGKNISGATQRQDFRGHDPALDARRKQAQGTLQQHGMDPAAERKQLNNDPKERARAQNATHDANRNQIGGANRAPANGGGRKPSPAAAQDNALRGAGNGQQARQQADRGSASRKAMTPPGSAATPHGALGHAPAGGFGRHH